MGRKILELGWATNFFLKPVDGELLVSYGITSNPPDGDFMLILNLYYAIEDEELVFIT